MKHLSLEFEARKTPEERTIFCVFTLGSGQGKEGQTYEIKSLKMKMGMGLGKA